MDVKQAVNIAARYVAEMELLLIDPDGAVDDAEALSERDCAVEGTRFDEGRNEWVIELGFVRPWDKVKAPLAGLASNVSPSKRTYKNVRISDADGSVVQYGDSRGN